MSIFGWGGETKEQLKDKIVELNNILTELRDAKITAQISESRAQSGFNAQQEADRGNHEIEVAQLTRKIQSLEADMESFEVYCERTADEDLQEEIAKATTSIKKELTTEFKSELETLKKEAKQGKEDSAKYQGLYNGTLLVIKALEAQLKEVNVMTQTLIKALPEVSANITTPNPSVVVGSGNKS